MRILIAGLGNVLMGDDGFGPFVAETIRARYLLPEGVEVEDLGTPGLDLAPYLMEADAVVLLDTVLSDAPPGKLRLYRKDDLLRHGTGPRTSPHDPGVQESLFALDLAGKGPTEMLLVGCVPQATGMSTELTGLVRLAVDPAVAAVVDELARLGTALTLAHPGAEPDVWWRRGLAGPGAALPPLAAALREDGGEVSQPWMTRKG